jgi:tetraacyldisaccharide 4'-kinase
MTPLRLNPPSWWYEPRPGIGARLLAPASWLVDRVAIHRLEKALAHKSALPVVCIGNFTAGGTGKTPLALLIASLVADARPAFLTRGYRGRLRGPHMVDAEKDTAADVGDEALLLARRAMTVVSRDRAEGARLIERLGAGMILMDDGMQSRQLLPNLTLAVVDGLRGIGNGAVIPAGPLRLDIGRQLRLADAIIVSGGGDGRGAASMASIVARFKGPILRAEVVPDGDTEFLRGKSFVAYAGIGSPARFFATARAAGAVLREEVAFGDHDMLSERQAERMLALAARHAAKLLTTEKDWVRLSGLGGARGELRKQSEILPVRTAFEPADLARLRALLSLALERDRLPQAAR